MASNRGSVLVEEYRPLAWAIARKYWWPGAELEDMRQEAMAALHEAARRWAGTGSFPNYARRVIRSRLIDCVRRETLRRPRLVPVGEWDEDVFVTDSLEDVVARRERLRLVDELPARERVVLRGAVQGYSYIEIGEALDLSPSVVKWTAWRARARLRELEEAA